MIALYLAEMDEIMKRPSTVHREKVIARMNNALEFENDSAMHFGLNYGWKKINNIKNPTRRCTQPENRRAKINSQAGG